MEVGHFGGTTFRITAVIITVTCLFYIYVMKLKMNSRSRLFLSMLYIVLVGALTGLISSAAYYSSWSYNVRYYVCYICKLFYFITHFALAGIFFFYIASVCDISYKFSESTKLYLTFPVFLLEIAALSNPFTDFAFSLDSEIIFHRSYGVYIAYAVSGAYLVASIAVLLLYWKSINKVKKFAMVYFFAVTIIGIMIQMLHPQIICELMCESIGLMGLMIMIEKEDDKLDSETKTYNRNVFLQDIKRLIDMNRSFKIICVRIDNSELYRKITGYTNFDKIVCEIAEFLLGLDGRFNIYRNGDAHFYMIGPEIQDWELPAIIGKIKDRFEDSFGAGESETKIAAKILVTASPEYIDSAEDIILLSDSPLSIDSEKMVLVGEELDFFLRNIAVEKAILNGVADNKFDVLYQPVYGKKCGCIKGCQAMLKLNDDKLGEIYYREFMPIAERIGIAEELQIQMIEAVFKFVSDSREKGIEMEFIVIHLMSVKVFNRNLVRRVKKLLDIYQIDPRAIAFDLNDALAGIEKDIIQFVISELYAEGFKLLLGNYEPEPLTLDSDVIDKFYGVILSAWRFYDPSITVGGDIIIKARTRMLTELGKKIIITGVDTRQLFDNLVEVSGDFLSGKELSGPVSGAKMQERFLSYDRVEANSPI